MSLGRIVLGNKTFQLQKSVKDATLTGYRVFWYFLDYSPNVSR